MTDITDRIAKIIARDPWINEQQARSIAAAVVEELGPLGTPKDRYIRFLTKWWRDE